MIRQWHYERAYRRGGRRFGKRKGYGQYCGPKNSRHSRMSLRTEGKNEISRGSLGAETVRKPERLEELRGKGTKGAEFIGAKNKKFRAEIVDER